MHVPGMVKVYTGLCLMDCFLPNEDIREAEWAMGLAFVCMCVCVCSEEKRKGILGVCRDELCSAI